MGEWRKYSLLELSDIHNEKRIPLSKMQRLKLQGKYPYYGASGIVDYINDYKFNGDYILISEDGENLKTRKTPIAFKASGKFWVNNHAHIIKGKTDYLDDLLIYFFSNLDLNQYLTGAVQPKLSKGTLLNIPIYLPKDESEKKAIAEVLSSLDDKIDLLHRQNKTLEELAQTLFRQWFIEEAKNEWEVGKVPDEFNFTMGLSPKGETFNEDGVGTPMYQGNADFEFRFPKNRVYTTDPKRYAEKFDTLISVRAPVGAQNMAKEKCCIGRGVASFRYKADSSFYTYTYFKMMSLMNEIKQFNDSGTVFGSINKTDFQNMKIIIPPTNLVVKYQGEVKPLDDKVIQNTFQIKILENMRDTLLPKLMNGEVRIKYE